MALSLYIFGLQECGPEDNADQYRDQVNRPWQWLWPGAISSDFHAVNGIILPVISQEYEVNRST